MKAKLHFALGVAWLATFTTPLSTWAQGTAFTYQGRLNTNGVPYSGSAEFQFTLWDAGTGGNALATNSPVNLIATVDNGLFNVTLDFGLNPFNGQARFLQTDVRTAIGPFTPLAPRQPVLATPYAMRAANFSGTVADNQLSANIARLNSPAAFAGPVSFSNATGNFSGAFGGNAAGLTNLNLVSGAGGGLTFEVGTIAFFLSSSPAVDQGTYAVIAADVNGDSKVDLISANLYGGTLSVLTNNGSGGFVISSSPGMADPPTSVAAADINGDGKVDLISSSEYTNKLSVLTNNGSGGFVLSSSPVAGNRPESVTTADVNSDGKADLITANYSGNTLSVLTNNGSGGFVLAASPGVGNGPWWVTAADVNGDARVDLISANIDVSTLSVLTNNGNGGFVLLSTLAVGVNPGSVAAADVNADGKTDLISANQNNTLTILTNNGNGFGLSASPAVGDWPFSVIAKDVNGDGKVDLISPLYGAKSLAILTNNGSGGFGLSSSPAVGPGPVSVAAADVNGDGKPDLISANFNGGSGNTLTVLFNSRQLNGVFTGNGTGLGGVNAEQLDGFNGSDFARLAANQNFTGENSFNNLTYFNGDTAFNGSFNYFYGDSLSVGANTFNGNVTLGNSAAVSFGAQTRQMLNLWNAQYGIGVQSGTLYFRSDNFSSDGGFAWFRGGTHNDNPQNPGAGGSTLMTLNANRLSVNTAVGLGTTSPAAKLHLYSADNPTTFRIQSTGTPGLGRIEFVSNPQGDPFEWRPAYIQSLDAGGFTGGLGFYLNGSGFGNAFGNVEVMRLVNGRVGIGTIDPQSALHVVGTVTATAFNPPSDRNLKENFAPVSAREVLDKVTAMPISRWNFKGDDATPHVGPMAQDFHAAFGLGTDDRHIATVDADGVALAAIQGLNQKLEERLRSKDVEIQALKDRLAEVDELKKAVARLERLASSSEKR